LALGEATWAYLPHAALCEAETRHPPLHRASACAKTAPRPCLAFLRPAVGPTTVAMLARAARAPASFACNRKFAFPQRTHATRCRPPRMTVRPFKLAVCRDVLSGGTPLEGGLLFISEPDTALQIRKGALCVRYRNGVERTFPRGRHRLRSIMLASPGANVTIEAMRFAIDEGITIFVRHRAGEAIAVLPTRRL
jgi:hypothetical protein